MMDAIALYTEICTIAIPYAVGFTVCNLLVRTFFKMAFGGKVEIR